MRGGNKCQTLCKEKWNERKNNGLKRKDFFFVFFRLSGSSFMSFKSCSIQMKTSSLGVKPAPKLCYVALVFQSSSFLYEIKEAVGLRGCQFTASTFSEVFSGMTFKPHISNDEFYLKRIHVLTFSQLINLFLFHFSMQEISIL